MTINETILEINSKNINKYLPKPQKSVFFDIETTGLHRKYSRLYLIGVIFCDSGTWKLRQWFAQKPTDEKEILQAFINFIQDYQYIIHYNGDSFDLPYLMSRCSFCQVNPAPVKELISIDLYRRIKPFRSILAMDKMTLKDVEEFMQIHRKDPFSGSDLIALYQEYLQTGSEQLLQALLLHNAEDVQNLPRLLPMLAYPLLFETDLSGAVFEHSDNQFVFSADLSYSLPKQIEYQHHHCWLHVSHNRLTMEISLFHGELKYFYENYKDYYYLPEEDRAVHKSIGAYVDKQYRTQANAANCYQKQQGIFAPQYEPVFTPVIKAEPKDKVLFFPCDKPELLPDNWQAVYAAHILQLFRGVILKK